MGGEGFGWEGSDPPVPQRWCKIPPAKGGGSSEGTACNFCFIFPPTATHTHTHTRIHHSLHSSGPRGGKKKGQITHTHTRVCLRPGGTRIRCAYIAHPRPKEGTASVITWNDGGRGVARIPHYHGVGSGDPRRCFRVILVTQFGALVFPVVLCQANKRALKVGREWSFQKRANTITCTVAVWLIRAGREACFPMFSRCFPKGPSRYAMQFGWEITGMEISFFIKRQTNASPCAVWQSCVASLIRYDHTIFS